ncbi:MAG: hypothetical protein AAF152_19120 [Cyanobacteria bacterium P01_A01_bin.114]
MSPSKPTPHLIRILGLGWLAYLLVGFGLSQASGGAKIQIVIDRSYCAPNDWQQVANEYAQLYQQHQQKQITLESVTLVNDLGEEVRDTPPSAEEIAGLNTFGLPGRDRINAIVQASPDAQVLSCQP